jgi:hypothetical protein
MAETRFGALKELRRVPSATVSAAIAEPLPPKPATPESIPPPARAPAKSTSQEFERLTIYVRKATKKAATRKWEDATGLDMSDLVEHLLAGYLITSDPDHSIT